MAHFGKSFKNKNVIDSVRGSHKHTQTEISYNELDINILKERLNVLEIENDRLKKENEALKKYSKSLNGLKSNKTFLSPSPLKQNVPLINSKHKGCTCKGNCANKICGCVKKDLQCSDSCKCDLKFCKNKELHKENHCKLTLKVKDKQPTESSSSIDDVFYDASDPSCVNATIDFDAVRKLTFNTDEDTPEKDATVLSAILENEEESGKQFESRNKYQKEEEGKKRTKSKSQVKSTLGKENTLKNKAGKVPKNRKGFASNNVTEKQSLEDPKVDNKSKKKSVSTEEDEIKKKQRKGSKLKQVVSVKMETKKDDEDELLQNNKINSRSRRNRGTLRSDDPHKEQIENKVPDKNNTVSNYKKLVLASPSLRSIKSSGLSSSRESISNIKQPKDWKKLRSSVSLDQAEEAVGNESLNNMKKKKVIANPLKNIITKATRIITSEEASVEDVCSRPRGLRRSFSSDAVSDKMLQKKLTNSKNKTKNNQIEAHKTTTLNRSMSNESLSKKPLKKFMSKVSSSFRKSSLANIQDKSENKNYLQVSHVSNISTIKEFGQDTSGEKSLKFDPMQPTRELSRSPIAAVNVADSPANYDRYSPPPYGRYLKQFEIKIGSPPPEILKDLCAEEVDLKTFQNKLVECRKCKRKFFPHRIRLHEAVCLKV